MVLYFVGLGLCDETDITLKGLEIVKRCKRVFLEAYTSILLVNKDKLEALYERSVEVADRQLVESEAHQILEDASRADVAFCVVGDPFGATTHTDLQLRARELDIPVKVIHNASIMNAIGACGLQLYKFGQTISVVFFTDTWRPDSFYDKIGQNQRMGLHTLCLLDIKVKEPSLEGLARGRVIYEEPRYMTVNECIEQLLELEDRRGEGVCVRDAPCVGVSRLGSADQQIVFGTLADLLAVDFGPPLHSLVICGALDEFEKRALELNGLEQH